MLRKTIAQCSWYQGARTKDLPGPSFRTLATTFTHQVPLPTSIFPLSPIWFSVTPWFSGKLTSPCHQPPPPRQVAARPTQAPIPQPTASLLTLNESISDYQATVVYSQLHKLPFPTDTRHPTPVYYFWRPVQNIVHYLVETFSRELNRKIATSRIVFFRVHIQVGVRWKM